jgi:hypothetical protein
MSKIKIFPLSPQTQIEASIGFTAGIFLGALGVGIVVLFFTPLAWYLKLISFIGEVGILGNLILALKQLLEQRKGLLEAQKEFGTSTIKKNKIKPEYIQ